MKSVIPILFASGIKAALARADRKVGTRVEPGVITSYSIHYTKLYDFLLSRRHRTSAARQRPEISESTLSRARTSSLRLVSWVDVASRASGWVRHRSMVWSWNASSGVPNRSGLPPTSFSETNRLFV